MTIEACNNMIRSDQVEVNKYLGPNLARGDDELKVNRYHNKKLAESHVYVQR